MDLILTEEQRLLQDSVARTVVRDGGATRARGLRGKDGGFDRAALRRMAEEGWLGILVPAEAGGLGLGATELSLVLMEAGRGLVPEPIGSVAIAAAALAGGGASDALERVIGGEAIVVPGFGPLRTGATVTTRTLTASAEGDRVVLDGLVEGIAHAAHADGYVIEAVMDDGPCLVWLSRDAGGLSVDHAATVDGRGHGTLKLAGARGSVVARGEAAVSRLFDLALVAVAAELVGVMSAALDMTVDYLKIRKQFGKPIGSFQALQHRAVDDFTRIVSSRSMLFQIAGQGEALKPAMAAALKSHVSGEALEVTKSAIQMHGGIGFTDEHDIGLYLKRAMWLSAHLGNAAHHRKRFQALAA